MDQKQFKPILNVALWKKPGSENYLSTSLGLTEADITYLQQLKAGDRLIIFKNTRKESEKQPDFNLKKYTPPTSDDSGGL